MHKIQLLSRTLIFILIASSCSVELTPVLETPQVEVTPLVASTSAFPATQVPVTWSHLNLTGRLVYLSSTTEGDELTSQVQMLDLVTGELRTVFSLPSAWIYYAAVSPDAKTLVMSYAPPKQSSTASVRSLYLLPLDTSAKPQPLFPAPSPADRYTQVEWSPDGKYMYYVHYNQDDSAGQFYEDYDISRVSYPEGAQEKILEQAFWPRLSSDSSKLVYVSLDPETGENELFVANSEGTNPQRVPLSGSPVPDIIDAPLFNPDGQSIIFSAPEATQARQPDFFESLLGVQIARAHNVPSDWWSVPITGGTPTQLTKLQTINLFASLSLDGTRAASLSGDGIFVMELDGSNLTQLVNDQGVHGTVSWIP